MTYLVTGNKPNNTHAATASVTRIHSIFDTEEEARKEAEVAVKGGALDVAVWQQIGVPRVERIVSW